MKKSKLDLEKFRIAKLSNSVMIIGGNGYEAATETEDGSKKKKMCILTSVIRIDDME
jgi:hypothetical protein